MALLVLILPLSLLPPSHPAAAAIRAQTGGRSVLVSLRDTTRWRAHDQQDKADSLKACIPATLVATLTPTVTPIAIAKASPTPMPTPTPGPVPTGCLVSASPALAFNIVGRSHTFTFLCGSIAAVLTGPAGSEHPTTGCFDLTASVEDITLGTTTSIASATCGGQVVSPTGGTVNCGSFESPICAAGYQPGGSSRCLPVCLAGFTSTPIGCTIAPNGGTCPAGSRPVYTNSGLIDYCLAPPVSTPGAQNEVTLTFSPGAPEAYLVLITGFVGTTPQGTCPPETTLVPNLVLGVGPNGPFSGPACAFQVSAEKKYVEATHLHVKPVGVCGGPAALQPTTFSAGTPCFFTVSATGTMLLKLVASCSGEPATGSDATGGGFPPGSVYVCHGDDLGVTNIPVPGALVRITAVNGFFSPTCLPASLLATPTVMPTPSSVAPTDTPVSAPSPTPEATAVSSGSAGLLCSTSGQTTIEATTSGTGTIGGPGNEVEYDASADPVIAESGGTETITGHFAVDLQPIPNVDMIADFHFPDHQAFCVVKTDDTGTAQCPQPVPQAPAGTEVPVDVTFVYDCEEYHTVVSFVIGPPSEGAPVPSGTSSKTAPAPPGICVARTGFGPITVEASIVPTINTQPPVSSGSVTLGEVAFATNTPVPTETSAPTSTEVTSSPTQTAVPTPTLPPSVTPTETPSVTPTATSTATPTRTPTSVPVLSVGLEAAWVARPGSSGIPHGLDEVHRGDRLWLMYLYTVHSVPKTTTFQATFQILRGRRVILSATFKPFKVRKTDLGSHPRYTDYVVARTLPWAPYVFRLTLVHDAHKQSRMWRFGVIRSPFLSDRP